MDQPVRQESMPPPSRQSRGIAGAPPPPAIEPRLQLKWGLALLGEEKAKQYLAWLQLRWRNKLG